MRLWHLRNTNLDLLFLVQIEAPRQGAEKCPETPKITNFTQNHQILVKWGGFWWFGVLFAPLARRLDLDKEYLVQNCVSETQK